MKKVLSTLIVTFLCFYSFSQSSNDLLFQKIEQLSFNDLTTFKEISRIEIELDSKYVSIKHSGVVTGWILNETSEALTILNTAGQEVEINKSDIKDIQTFSTSDDYKNYLAPYSFMDSGMEILTRRYKGNDIMPHILVAHWLRLNNSNSSTLLISKVQKLLYDQLDTKLTLFFGNLYYNEMLIAFAETRNRDNALKFGHHLNQLAFSNFQYYNQVNLLTDQLENRPEDFVSFKLPDSLSWVDIQKKLTRTEQIEYLLDRLRLLNCLQPGQPAWINYTDTQTSIPSSEITENTETTYFSDGLKKYTVINPFNELQKMNIQISELTTFLPYLKKKEFITSYGYWRDFSSHRELYPVAEVVLTLLFEITNKKFVERDFFDLSEIQKDVEIKKINTWIVSNSNTSLKSRIKEILVSTNDWGEFKNAMKIAEKIELENLFELLNSRIGDFETFDWPSPSGTIAEKMMNTGTIDDVDLMSKHLQSEDEWVRMWASLFLIKHDATSFETSVKILKEVLDSGDGKSYYPRAIPILLETKDSRLLELAEGFLEKNNRDDSFFLMMNDDIFRRLLLAGSQKTLEFFRSVLNDCNPTNRMTTIDENENTTIVLTCDNYSRILNNWRLDEYLYDSTWNPKKQRAYSKELSNWLTLQFTRIKNGENHYLKTSFDHSKLSYTFVDSPGRY